MARYELRVYHYADSGGRRTVKLLRRLARNLPKLSDFYRATDYEGRVRPEDVVIVATEGDSIVGVGRLSREEGVLVLRGMMVLEGYRGRGIGASILEALSKEIGDCTCYCVPYAHLLPFYERVGFQTVPVSSGPQFLHERVATYIERGQDVILMRRGETSSLVNN